MAYSISYDHIPLPKPAKKRIPRKKLLCGICAVVFVACLVWIPGIAGAVQQFFFPGSDSTTVQALEDMVSNISEGEPVGEAVYAFCQDVFQAAEN